MEEFGKITIRVKRLLGVAKPFPQGGVWRLTIPKRVVKEYKLEEKLKEKEYFSYIFLDTDKGLLLLPLDKVVNPKNIREALEFMGKLSLEEIGELLEE
jgi:hypothetical protein